jgi:glyoxylase-like metal-dependent hydrolase (beta-lactamase superfamily II)
VTERRKRELGRADRVLPGLWRLRLPLPWPGVPHGNAWAIASGDGIVLVDTGIHEPGSMRQLELALDQAGLTLDHVRLLVCTHAHSDHYGQAAPIIEAAGCELWIHPALDHMRSFATDMEGAMGRRMEGARRSGVPQEVIDRFGSMRASQGSGVAAVVEPDRELLPGVEVQTDLGAWQVHETPGHAPSHVVLHQPERKLLISGDHLLGRVSLYYDYGHTPDPVGEFLDSLDVVDGLDVDLILAGHGRPVRGAKALAQANRDLVDERLAGVRTALADGPQTVFEMVIAGLDGSENARMRVIWAMGETFCYLQHLELRDEVVRETDDDGVERWRLAAA